MIVSYLQLHCLCLCMKICYQLVEVDVSFLGEGTVQSEVPPLSVVIRVDGLLVDAPRGHTPHLVPQPVFSDISEKTIKY